MVSLIARFARKEIKIQSYFDEASRDESVSHKWFLDVGYAAGLIVTIRRVPFRRVPFRALQAISPLQFDFLHNWRSLITITLYLKQSPLARGPSSGAMWKKYESCRATHFRCIKYRSNVKVSSEKYYSLPRRYPRVSISTIRDFHYQYLGDNDSFQS